MSIEYIGMIMYDLPMHTDNEILRYKNFRKKLRYRPPQYRRGLKPNRIYV